MVQILAQNISVSAFEWNSTTQRLEDLSDQLPVVRINQFIAPNHPNFNHYMYEGTNYVHMYYDNEAKKIVICLASISKAFMRYAMIYIYF